MSDASLGTATLRTQLDTTGLTAGLGKAEQATTDSVKKIADRFDDIGKKLQKVGAGLSLAITTPLTALAGVGIRSAMQLETFSASLKVLIGDAGRAEAAFKDLYEFSANAPFSWESLTEGTRILAAFGTEAEDLVPTLSKLGDVAAGVQTPIEDLAEAYGRMQLTGRVGTLDLQRLAARGIPIYTELADVLGVSEGKVQELVSAGKVGFPQIERAFTNMTSEGGKFYNVMAAQADTVAGRLNRLKDSFSQVTDVIGERLLPIFDRLISVGQATTDWFVNLDETTQSLIVGVGGLAAAAGPLIAGLGTIIKLLPVLKAGLLALTGPTGLIVLGVAAVAGLAVALAGSGSGGEPSLETAIGKVSVAASNTAAIEGLDTSLTTLANSLTGNVRRAFQGARDDILAIVGAAEDARAKLAAISLGTELAQQAQNNPILRSSIESAFTIGWDKQPAQLLRDALFTGDFKQAIGVAEDLLRRYTDIGSEMDMTALTQFLGQLRGADSALAKLLSGASGNGNGNGNGNGAGGIAGKRTWEQVLKELDDAGAAAMRRAALEGTPAAYREAARKRVALLDDAINTALSSEFYGKIDPSAVEKLWARLEQALLEAAEPNARRTSSMGPRSIAERDRLEAGGPSLGMANSTLTPEEMQAIIERRLTQVQTKWADYLADELGREYNRFLSLLPSRVVKANEQAYLRTLNDSEQELNRWLNTAGRLTTVIKAANDETARMGLFADALAKYGSGRAGLAGTSAADRTGGRFPDRDVAAGMLRDTVVATVEAFREGKVGVAEVQAAVDAWTSVMPQSVKAINDLTEGILLLDRAAQDAARTAMQNELAPLWTPSSGTLPIVKDFTDKFERSLRDGWKAPGDASSGVQRSNVITWQDAQRTLQAQEDAAAAAAKAQQDAADRFASTVISAGFSFGDAAIKAFQDGDIVGVIRAGLSGAGSIFSGLDAKDSNILGTISLFGGTLGIGSLIAGGLGLIGTLIGALTGGGRNREDLERVRASGAATRGAPSIDLSVIINQSLSVQSLTDPAGKTAVNNLLLDTVRRLEDAITRNIIPRVTALEGGAA